MPELESIASPLGAECDPEDTLADILEVLRLQDRVGADRHQFAVREVRHVGDAELQRQRDGRDSEYRRRHKTEADPQEERVHRTASVRVDPR